MLLCWLFAAVIFYSCNTVNLYRNVSVECRDQMYACGECGQRYLITDAPKLMPWLQDNEIKVKWESLDLEARYDSITSSCTICYTHEFTGDLRISSDTVLIVKKFTPRMREGCCETNIE